jgi:hypothetical protein
MDIGTAYGRPRPASDATLVEVGPGTPGGELLRRYWHPIAVSAEITSRPRIVRVLGEDLVVFRDLAGRPGLLYPRCCHRGTTLYYDLLEEHAR